MHKSKKKSRDVAYKIDLEKAYDNIEWDYLKEFLIDLGFPSPTINLIMYCVSSSTLSLLWISKKLPVF